MTTSRRADLQSALGSLAESAAHLCEADDAVILRIEDDHFCIAGHYGLLSAASVGQTFPIRSDWLSGRVFKEGGMVNVHDVALESCTDFDNETPQNGARYRSVLAGPTLRDGQIIGVMAIRRRRSRRLQ